MSLIELVDNTRTDKNTIHSYLELYEVLLCRRKYMAKNILEIGIYQGGSIKLWDEYFPNAKVYGVDIMEESEVWEEIKNKDKICLFTSTNAYDPGFWLMMKKIKFDMILDDGPHTLESMQTFIRLYSQLLSQRGILILEDIQHWSWINVLRKCVPANLKRFVKVYDLRKNKGRYDDIVLVIDKK